MSDLPALAANGSVAYGSRIPTAMQIATSPAMAMQLIGDASSGRSTDIPSERPAIEARFHDRPQDGADCQQPVEVSAPTLATPEHDGGSDQCDARDHVVQRAAERGEADAAGGEYQADQQQDGRK